MQYSIRFATVDDIEGIAQLFVELGHEVSASSIAGRWSEGGARNDGVIVAETEQQQLAGMITIDHFHPIHRESPVGRVTALIVASDFRGHGIGRDLLQTGERHLVGRGCCRIEIVSNNRYSDAHRFYQHLEYDSSGVRLHKNVRKIATRG